MAISSPIPDFRVELHLFLLSFQASLLESQRHIACGFQRLINRNHDDNVAFDLESFAAASQTDPPLPFQISRSIQNLIADRRSPRAVGPHDPPVRQASRQQQLMTMVDKALQSLNDRDEEGRSLPEELTENDVGRTVLRRAEPEDFPRVIKLLSSITNHSSKKKCKVRGAASSSTLLGPVSVLASEFDSMGSLTTVSEACRSWSSCTVVLLLCRAIAAYEDPPLGCAVLTLGFTMERGRVFRVAQIANEPHLPKERFLECLEDFCRFAKCNLQVEEEAASTRSHRFSNDELWDILESHIANHNDGRVAVDKRGSLENSIMTRRKGSSRSTTGAPRTSASPFLSSVREESEASDESSEKRTSAKRKNKPSKRSRVE